MSGLMLGPCVGGCGRVAKGLFCPVCELERRLELDEEPLDFARAAHPSSWSPAIAEQQLDEERDWT